HFPLNMTLDLWDKSDFYFLWEEGAEMANNISDGYFKVIDAIINSPVTKTIFNIVFGVGTFLYIKPKDLIIIPPYELQPPLNPEPYYQ
ncbi:hypothetical protein, partial [Candidatus Electrothrix sp.]|uniref:hypothetical protein n=1 Tax=Candidatus Electrothrix sp. TaxID=2170559 RepID=UPI004055A0D8